MSGSPEVCLVSWLAFRFSKETCGPTFFRRFFDKMILFSHLKENFLPVVKKIIGVNLKFPVVFLAEEEIQWEHEEELTISSKKLREQASLFLESASPCGFQLKNFDIFCCDFTVRAYTDSLSGFLSMKL